MAKKNRDKDKLPKAKFNKENLASAAGILKFLLPHKWKFLLGMLFLVLTSATALIFPRLMGDLMGLVGSKNINKTDLQTIANGLGIKLFVLFGLQAVFSFFRVVLFVNVTENTLRGLRIAAYNQLIRMPMVFFSRNQVSELNSRISTDINQIQDTFTTNIAEFIRQLIIIIGGIVIICYTSLKLALIMLATIPILALLTVYFGRKIRGYASSTQDEVAKSNIIVGESLLGITNVKSFTNEAYEIERYTASTRNILELAMKGGIARGAFFSFIIFCLFGTIVYIVWYATQLTISDALPAKDMMSFLFYTVFVSASIGGIAEQYAQIQRALGATQRVLELINGDIENISLDVNTPADKRFEGKVDFKNIEFSYPTRKEFKVLKNVSFSAEKGQTIAIVGPSGSGKSTLASLLLRFYEPQSGEIIIDGKKSTEHTLTKLREQMAIVPQDVLLFGGSIRENIAYGKTGATFDEITEAAKKANAYDFIMSFPEKFETIVGERGIQLSGGQRQRIAIARAVLKNPSILILDEATSSLDSESERVVQEALDKLMENRTSFVVAHRLSTIRKANIIVVLEKGVVVETGTHEELMRNENGLYKSLVRLQYELQ
ncbi:MAG: ATP-binding cassette domain-containing protein [Bacteroidia bacterium]|nr:ATP-binding cassette domain-containing protein [Bacteroidia bacterium]